MPSIDAELVVVLAEDIREHGLLSPIKTIRGKILDGRHRWFACRAAGVEPVFEKLPADTDPYRYLASANLMRRNLSTDQCAACAAEYAAARDERENEHENQPPCDDS